MADQDVKVPDATDYVTKARAAAQEGERGVRNALAFGEFLLILAVVPVVVGVVGAMQTDAATAWLAAGASGAVAMLISAFVVRTLSIMARNSSLSLELQALAADPD